MQHCQPGLCFVGLSTCCNVYVCYARHGTPSTPPNKFISQICAPQVHKVRVFLNVNSLGRTFEFNNVQGQLHALLSVLIVL